MGWQICDKICTEHEPLTAANQTARPEIGLVQIRCPFPTADYFVLVEDHQFGQQLAFSDGVAPSNNFDTALTIPQNSQFFVLTEPAGRFSVPIWHDWLIPNLQFLRPPWTLDFTAGRLLKLTLRIAKLAALPFALRLAERFLPRHTTRAFYILAFSANWLLIQPGCLRTDIAIFDPFSGSAFTFWKQQQYSILAFSAGWLLPLDWNEQQTTQTRSSPIFFAGNTHQPWISVHLTASLAFLAGWLLPLRPYLCEVDSLQTRSIWSDVTDLHILITLFLAFSAGWLLPLVWWIQQRIQKRTQKFFSVKRIGHPTGVFHWWLLILLPTLAFLAGWLLTTFIQIFTFTILFGTASLIWHWIAPRLAQHTQLVILATTARDTTPGPKSGHSRAIRLLLILAVLGLMITHWPLQFGSGGEGSGLTTGATEVPDTWETSLHRQLGTKSRGTQPAFGCGTTWQSMAKSNMTKVLKRSLHRAYNRAVRDGVCWYKGQCYTPEDFHEFRTLGAPTRALPTLHQNDHVHCNTKHQSSRHLRIFHWNGGGLSAHKLDELKMWLSQQRVDVAVLSESRWSFTNEWTADGWNHIHSGNPTDRGAGLLVLVSTKVSRLTDIRWAEIIPGRLMHVQLRYRDRHVDVMACYQHTFSQTASRLQERAKWFQQLDKYLGQLSKRNVLMIAGDMNCSLPAMQGHVGTATVRWKNRQHLGTQHPDTGQFAALVKANDLCVLNSWSSRTGPTFFHAHGVSRIDFFMTRMAIADGTARAVRYLHTAPFLSCNSHGHVPMLTQIRRFWMPPTANQQTAGITANQRETGRRAYLNQDPSWHHFMLQSSHAFCTVLDQAQTQTHADHVSDSSSLMEDLHAIAGQCFCTCFPVGIHNLDTAKRIEALPIILNKWTHRRLCMRIQITSVKNIFRAWFHLMRFQVQRRAHQKYAQLIRAQKFQQIMDQASQAAQRSDSYALFQVINRFSPKQPRRRMQLRNANGCLATPVEELAILTEHVRVTWQGPHQVPMPRTAPTALPFTVNDLERALREIPLTKAVARPFTPGLIWKAHASLLAPALYSVLQNWWSRPDPWIPSCWRDAWLILIPKPGKKTSDPASLRPLALQEPIGKSIVGLLAQHLQRTSYSSFAPLPIWAYIPSRSTQHALHRVAVHTKAGRTLVASQRPTVFHRQLNLPTYKVCGAIQLFLDLQRAFDNVCREELFARLPELNVHPKVHQLLAGWHQGTCYHVTANNGTTPVQIGSGVRQGCKAAPMLFNAFLYMYLTDLSQYISWSWICEHLDVYADDIHVGALFYNRDDLSIIMRNFGIIMEVLQKKGMTINTSKSAVLLTMGGTSFRQLRKQLISGDSNGEKIKITGLTASFDVPLVKQTKYLGTIVSYANMEQATLQHRVTLSKLAFARLRKWLTARRGLSLRHRILMWKTCVIPVLTYGLLHHRTHSAWYPQAESHTHADDATDLT